MDQDSCPDNWTTGDQYEFRFTLLDDLGISGAWISWQHGNMSEQEVMLQDNGDQTWSHVINLDHSVDDMNYSIRVVDLAGNKKAYGPVDVTVRDNDRPNLIGYNAPQRCTTGDEFTFTVNAEDNIDVEDVSMEWSHGNAGGNLSLQRLDDTTWECSVTTDVGSIEDLTYQIFIRDTAGNYRIEVPHYLPVKDNDPPGFQGDESGDNATTGDKFFFVILPFDNIKVSEVLVNWSHGEFNNVSHYLRDDGNGRWTGNITLDLYSVSELEYYVRIADDVGNSIETHHRFVPVRDDDTPLFQHETMEETPRTGETFNVTMILKDNIAIDKVWFKYTFQNREQLEKMMAFEGNDTWKVEIFIPQVAHAIEYHLIAEDGSGNRMDSVDHVGMIVKDVEDVITPVAVINSPVAVDQHQEVAFNGHGSADNMGIVNFTWRIEYDDDQVILFDVEAYFVFHKAGTWPVSLTVFDAYNNENTSWTEILVRDITPPFADAGENVEIGQGKEVVRAANVDDNVWVKTVIWSFDYDEKPREIRDIEFRWFFETPGIYNISLAVKDEANNIAIDFMIVTVRDTEPPHPVVFHGERKLKGGENDPNATQGDEIVLNGDASRDNVEIVEHRWVIKLGEDEEVRLGNELRYIFDNAGRYIIILVVKDEAGNDNETRFEIDVRIKDDENPVAHVNWEGEYIEANDRYEVKKGTTILFHAEDSTDNVGIAGFKWVVNGPAGHKQFTGVDMSYEFREVGTYAFKLTVTDGGGNQDMFEMTFEAMEEKPEGAEVGPITNTDGEPIAGATVTLDVDGETFTAVTDENGIAVFDTSFRDVPKGAKYIAEKDGERIEWEEGEARPNFLKSAEKEEGIPVLYLAIGAVVLMLIIIILFLVIRKRKRTGDGGAEGVGTTAAQGEEEGDLPEEEGGFEPVDKPPAEARKGKKKEKPGRKKADAKKAGKGRKKPGAKAAMETERVTETDYEDDEEEAEGEAEDEAQDEAEEWDDGDVEGEWDGEDWDDEETDDEEELELPPPPEDLKDHLGALTLEKVSSGIKNILPGYIITDKLGAGGFATVYKAINKDGDAVAIKMPKFLDETIDSSVLNKFRAESDIWKKLKHRNIVTFLDSDIRPVPYMAIELMEGGNLGGLLKDHRLSVQEAKPLMLQILDGLSYAHRMASVHRDIKPENILFTKDGIPKIADWGIGKFMASESVSQSIGTKGTFLYSAPEQFDKETYGAVDWSTDIFQIGVVFYEMLTGINPFKADELAAVMGRILTKQPEPPSSLNPEIPPELDEIVMTCLEKNKDDRWRSTDVLYSKLKDMEKRKQGSIKKYRRSLERALRDGTISDDEEAMLSELREHMGITDAEHRAMIDDISGEIFKIDA